MTSTSLPKASTLFSLSSHNWLRWTSRFWFGVTALGQLGFIAFILAFYGRTTLSGNFANWNVKPKIDGYIAGDDIGNLVFITHVLMASVITGAGLLQLVPYIRQTHPRLHRWSGRVFISLSMICAITGIGLTWIRGSHISLSSAVAVTINGLLILVFGTLALRTALVRRFKEHRRWALRTFMVVSGVWFFRVLMMAWAIMGRGTFGLAGDVQLVVDQSLNSAAISSHLRFSSYIFARNVLTPKAFEREQALQLQLQRLLWPSEFSALSQ